MTEEELDKIVADYEETYERYYGQLSWVYQLEAELRRNAFLVQVGTLRELIAARTSRADLSAEEFAAAVFGLPVK